MSLVVCADELVTVFRVGLLAMAVEEVVLELALVLEPLWAVEALGEHVIGEGALGVGAGFEYQHALAVGFPVGELANIEGSVIFEETAISTGIAHLTGYEIEVRYWRDLSIRHRGRIW